MRLHACMMTHRARNRDQALKKLETNLYHESLHSVCVYYCRTLLFITAVPNIKAVRVGGGGQ